MVQRQRIGLSEIEVALLINVVVSEGMAFDTMTANTDVAMAFVPAPYSVGLGPLRGAHRWAG